jgi:hypothetical protein
VRLEFIVGYTSRSAWALLGVLCLIAYSTAPAQAITQFPSDSGTDDTTVTLVTGTLSETFVDADCFKALSEAGISDASTQCTVSESKPVTAATIAADASLSTAEKAGLQYIATSSTVRSKSYSNFITGLSYTVTQNGTFYYNGSRVWVTQTYLGRNGSQFCVANYAVPPWSVSNFSKSDTGSTTVRTVRCSFDVNQAGLIVTNRTLVAKLTSSGSVTY